jgi:toxin YoeB
MELQFNRTGWEDYLWWQEHDRKMLKRINKLLEETLREPAGGIGKPEQLKTKFVDLWSRRITLEHRLVYAILEDTIVVVQLRHHY